MNHDDLRQTPSTARAGTLWLTAASFYFFLAAATIYLTSDGRSIASVWPANAVLLALLLTNARPRFGVVLSAGFVANMVANQVMRGSIGGPALYGLCNILEVWLAAKLLRRAAPATAILESAASVCRFALIAGVIAPTLSGVFGSATAWLTFDQPLARSFVTWVVSDSLGLLVFTPLFAALFRGDFAAYFHRKTWRKRAEGLALLAITVMVVAAVFYVARLPMLFAVYPPIMLLTFRVGRLGTKFGVVVVAVVGGVATITGHGPIAAMGIDPVSQAHLFQAFLAVLLMTCLPVAAEVAERSRLAAQLAEQAVKMAERAVTDPLTGVMNRAGFEERAERAIASATARPTSLIAIDVDRFKSINDRWGHSAGDAALRHIAVCLQENVRTGDLVGRPGGDEFLVLLPSSTIATAHAVGERVRDALRRGPVEVDDKTSLLLSLSMGIVTAQPGESLPQLIERADRALYQVKRSGRDAICCVG